ncbi:MAG: M14 family zinc carboxypeptidase, partial [Candidatus Marinimicrobia bacterium]|nr:M14 family zinc carboxypeptidase [Candidatus Neomarinimicrobiota bacterium]
MSTFYRTLTSVALLVSLLSSQEEIQFPLKIDGVRYSSDIPEPQDVIGHSIGTRHTRPHQIVEYFNAVAEVSRRVIVRQHATTWEGRRLIHAVVTSPENHSRLESIRENNLRMFDSAGGISDKDLGTMPGIVYLGYSIHGNEASGSEAAVLTLYHLAAGQGREIRDLLEHNVILIDPMLNPDGRDRFVDWANSNRSNVITSDGQDREHNEPWPGGRTNHYWFDLNRDWLPAEHPESNGRIALFHHWQ